MGQYNKKKRKQKMVEKKYRREPGKRENKKMRKQNVWAEEN